MAMTVNVIDNNSADENDTRDDVEEEDLAPGVPSEADLVRHLH